MADAILKRCNRCGETKPLDHFQPTHGRCRPCLLAVRREKYHQDAEFRESIKAKNRAWGMANKEKKAAMDREYVRKNRDKVRQTRRAYKLKNWDQVHATQNRCRQRNPETYRANEAAYRAKNRQICNERIREWKVRNPHKTVHYENKRRAAEIQAIPTWADLDAISQVYERARAMGKEFHVDHAVPLIAKTVCGLHCEANLEIVPAAVNLKKNNHRWPDMWEPE